MNTRDRHTVETKERSGMLDDANEDRTQAKLRPVRYSKACVNVVGSAAASFEVTRRTLRVGSCPNSNDLVIADPTVSRRHCELVATERGIHVRDLDSTNGIFAAGVRIYDAVFSANVDLQVGSKSLRLVLDPQGTEAASAPSFGSLIGRSARMRALYADLERVAKSSDPVLIEGETGSGKELVARSLHDASPFAAGPYVVFNAGAINTLIDDELFGHVAGAFANAHRERAGLFEEADGGTLFIDELGELPLEMQPKLLRVLQDGKVRRLGSNTVRQCRFRLIAATNRDLAREVRAGRFREDLLNRVEGHLVQVPPLRERMEDLDPLVEYFLGQLDPPLPNSAVDPDTWAMLRRHRWPGNVRELRNVIRRFAVTPERLFPRGASVAEVPRSSVLSSGELKPLSEARQEAAEEFERQYLDELMFRVKGNRDRVIARGDAKRAGAIAQVSRQMVQRLLKKHWGGVVIPEEGEGSGQDQD
jgi:DNA-binding NtrC family response regulator